MTPPLVTLEEHFYSKAVLDSLDERGAGIFKQHPSYLKLLQDIDGERMTSMNENNVHLQIISHCWQTGASPQACRAGNDELASRIKSHPDRFAAFAVLPIADGQACADELDRTVRQLGFVGALIDNHLDGKFFDGPEYDPLWQKAVELDVPIYLHPTLTPQAVVDSHFSGHYSAANATTLAMESWGWHADTGLHVLRLFSAGVFDRNPDLKIIIGHFGEMLPFMLERCQYFSRRFDPRQRDILDVWRKNIYITTSGVWSLSPMRCLLDITNIDHIMYSVDWPFTSNEEGRKWFESLEKSGMLDSDDLEKVAYKNAERLLKVKTPRSIQLGSVTTQL